MVGGVNTHRFHWLGAVIVLGWGLVVPAPAIAAVITLRPVADTTLQSAYPTYNYGDGTSFTAGGRRQGGATRALVRFDIAGNLPAGSIIQSASLSLRVVGTPSGGAGSVFDLNRLTVSWGEGTGSDHGGSPAGAGAASWNNRFGSGGLGWATPGGDFVSAASASRSIAGNGSYPFNSTATLVSDVQSWLDNAAGNFGWLLHSESESTPTTIRRFGSRDDALNFPTLTINYLAVPEPGAATLLVLGLAAVGWQRRRRD
jgi:hypothetical protein